MTDELAAIVSQMTPEEIAHAKRFVGRSVQGFVITPELVLDLFVSLSNKKLSVGTLWCDHFKNAKVVEWQPWDAGKTILLYLESPDWGKIEDGEYPLRGLPFRADAIVADEDNNVYLASKYKAEPIGTMKDGVFVKNESVKVA
jgi:hypothetical protein